MISGNFAMQVLMYLNHWVTDSTRAVVNKYRQRRSGVAESNVPEETVNRYYDRFSYGKRTRNNSAMKIYSYCVPMKIISTANISFI